MFRLFPLLFIPIVVYNLFVFGGGLFGAHDVQDLLSLNHGLSLHMFSGDTWKVSGADFFIIGSLVLLFIEVVKSTHTTSTELINHGLSLAVFVVALVEFLMLKGFATSPFFYIVLMTLFDVIAGYTISIIAAEHDLGIGRAGTD